ncbi:transporter substrate-binding domain-containing protein [Agrobacterium rhizogenes]|uniref:transporter substrate-binding domain-containing protein n=1 Tax=Rhizobium rhizogenes TaxID=359 RepID=UPI0022B7209B|nr:transporter substrate-binding domain-containing protein [Rhizobium rhizogenes]MCZ7450807.1 transporter substrate-binding domain-containing protein [Rhizobium rhizogenes]
MTIRKFLTMGAVLAVAAFAVAPASADTLADIKAAGKLRVSIDLASPPNGMLDGGLEATGSDVETAELLAKDWGVELEIVQTTGATRIPNLQTNKADIVISTLAVTEERKQAIDFSTPYSGQLSMVGGPASMQVKDWSDLKGKVVTVCRGTTQDVDMTKRSSEVGFTIARYDDEGAMVTAAVSGQATIVASSEALIKQIAIKAKSQAFEPKFTIRVFDLAVGVRKNEPQLLAAVNDWVSTNLKNGKLNEIYERYHGHPLPDEIVKGK